MRRAERRQEAADETARRRPAEVRSSVRCCECNTRRECERSETAVAQIGRRAQCARYRTAQDCEPTAERGGSEARRGRTNKVYERPAQFMVCARLAVTRSSGSVNLCGTIQTVKPTRGDPHIHTSYRALSKLGPAVSLASRPRPGRLRLPLPRPGRRYAMPYVLRNTIYALK